MEALIVEERISCKEILLFVDAEIDPDEMAVISSTICARLQVLLRALC